jgi:hypothetical protein
MATRYKKLVLPDGSLIDEHRYIMQRHLGRKLTRDECVHHINNNPRDNRIENLELMTLRQHAQHHLRGKPGRPLGQSERMAVSLRCCGEQTNFHKLTAAEVVEIRQRRKAGEGCQSLGDEFGVHRSTIRRACTGEHWWCIPGEGITHPFQNQEAA